MEFGVPYTTVKRVLRQMGVTLTKRGGVYRVYPASGDEAAAFHTSDLRAAYNTGRAMARRHASPITVCWEVQ